MFSNVRLKQRRLDMGLTLEEVGNIVGVSRSAVQKYEKGKIINIYTSIVELFAKALRCSPAYLMCWSDEPNETLKKDEILNSTEYTAKERKIIQAYKDNPEMQEAVNRLLGVEEEYAEDLIMA